MHASTSDGEVWGTNDRSGVIALGAGLSCQFPKERVIILSTRCGRSRTPALPSCSGLVSSSGDTSPSGTGFREPILLAHIATKLAYMASPVAWLFSGWN